jgi:S1-C subfamily serine protease
VRTAASDSSERQLRQIGRTIDSLVRAFEMGDLNASERFRIGRTIDALVAEFKAKRMQLEGASTVKVEGPYIAQSPLAPSWQTYVDTRPMRVATSPDVPRGWIGIVVSGAPRETHVEGNELMMRFLSYPEIASVDPSSPAQRAGLAPGDTLLAYDGRDLRGTDISMTKLLRPNARVMIRVKRGGRIKELPVIVAEAPSRIKIRIEDENREAGQSWFYTTSPKVAGVPPLAPTPPMGLRTPPPAIPPAIATTPPAPVVLSLPRPYGFAPSGVAGAQLVTVTDGIRRSLGVQSGVLVATVPAGTPADESGLREGDVIIRVDRQPVRTVVQVWQIVTRAAEEGEKDVALDLIREKQERSIKLRW